MRWPRPTRIVAVARRDLSMELKHRRGWILPAVMAGLLVPATLVGSPSERVATGVREWFATGDVPSAVRTLDDGDRRGQRLHFVDTPDAPLRVVAGYVPEEVRAALDGGRPTVEVTELPVGMVFPNRSALFALIATSSLTGALSASVGGERSNRTLVTLLTSGLTRLEIVLGKWAAWGGFGAFSAVLAATIAVAMGRIPGGLWLVPLPVVPLATVAMGLWLVRRAPDVVAGSAVSLRVLPALLAVTGLAAWFLGRSDPHLGALIPLGGALVASGDTWFETPTAPLLAAASSAAFAGWWLVRTAADLDEVPATDGPERRNTLAAGTAALGAAAWWTPMTMAVLWHQAGNPLLAEGLPVSAGVWAGALGLGTILLVRAGASPWPLRDLGLERASLPGVLAVCGAAGVGVALATLGTGVGGLPLDGAWADLSSRLSQGLGPGAASGAAIVAGAVIDELLFRGWLQRRVGVARAAAAWWVVKAPLDPVYGLLVGLGLGHVAARAGTVGALAARLALVAAVATLPPLPTALGVGLAAVVVAALWLTPRR